MCWQNLALLQSLGCVLVCAALQMYAGKNFKKCETKVFYSYFFVSRPNLWPIGLCHDMSVVILHWHCVRFLWQDVPHRFI